MAQGQQCDLIAAVATPPGQGGIGVVRLSGPGAQQTAQKVCGKVLKPRVATLCDFKAGEEIIDQGIALLFSEGASFTGEEVVELQGHGGPVVLQRLLDTVCQLGARLALPGEFSERAFLNGKLDLTQAEAIADLIASTSVSAARAAVRSLQGAFSTEVHRVAEDLARLRVLVEACIDFPDEDVEFLEDGQVAQRIREVTTQLKSLRASATQGQLLNEGAAVALIGAPNAGKSSLLNVLSGQEAAIVTDIPGTTRDLLKVDLVIKGIPIRLVDTAGIRDSIDEVERIGVARAKDQARQADLLLLIVDAAATPASQWGETVTALMSGLQFDGQVAVVMNKIDLLDSPSHQPAQVADWPTFWVSAKQGQGVDELQTGMAAMLGRSDQEAAFTARSRHLVAVDSALEHLSLAAQQLALAQATEIIAEELSMTHQALGEIVGTVTPDDLLGRIFSEFCIGK